MKRKHPSTAAAEDGGDQSFQVAALTSLASFKLEEVLSVEVGSAVFLGAFTTSPFPSTEDAPPADANADADADADAEKAVVKLTAKLPNVDPSVFSDLTMSLDNSNTWYVRTLVVLMVAFVLIVVVVLQ